MIQIITGVRRSRTVLNLEFEDTTWMDNINKVIVNDKECKKSTINSFSSDTNIWEVGSATGAYGSYKALKLAVPDGKLWTVSSQKTKIRL